MLFKKRKIYKVVWAYDIECSPDTEYVKAFDIAHAWKKIKRQHAIPIQVISIEEVK